MTTEQGTQLAQLAAELDAAYRTVHAIMRRLDGDMHDVVGAEVRGMVLSADMQLDTAAEMVARMAKGVTNG